MMWSTQSMMWFHSNSLWCGPLSLCCDSTQTVYDVVHSVYVVIPLKIVDAVGHSILFYSSTETHQRCGTLKPVYTLVPLKCQCCYGFCSPHLYCTPLKAVHVVVPLKPVYVLVHKQQSNPHKHNTRTLYAASSLFYTASCGRSTRPSSDTGYKYWNGKVCYTRGLFYSTLFFGVLYRRHLHFTNTFAQLFTASRCTVNRTANMRLPADGVEVRRNT
jgi:hypothetical protein